MSSSRCLVDGYYYHVGMVAPAIVIALILGFMRKRVKLRPELFNGRPALPVPIDFLGKDRNRFATVLAFGTTAASCFAMFFDVIQPGTGISATLAAKHMPKTPWAKAFTGVLMTILYGIINFPYLACLHAEYKMIGYAIGLFYTFIRLIIDLFQHFGCHDDELLKNFEKIGLGYLPYGQILLDLPVLICSFLLIGCYAVLLYKEIKKCCSSNLTQFQDILNPEPTSDERIAEEEDRNHVVLVLKNKVNQKRVPQVYEPFYITLKHKLYKSRPDFKFSTQFLSPFLVSFIFIYQLTVMIMMIIPVYKFAINNLADDGNQLSVVLKEPFKIFLDYVYAAALIACFLAILQLGFLLRSHRDDVLKTYRSRKGKLPDENLKPKMIVGKSLRYCGYQIALTGIGYLCLTLALLSVLLIVYVLHLMDIMKGREAVLDLIKSAFLSLLPIVFVPLLIWFLMVMLCMFVFRDKSYPDITIHIDNRRLYGILSYFFFFLNILVGFASGLSRVIKGAVLGLVFLSRLDRTSMMTGYRKWDRGYMAYIGFLNVLVAFRHPIMLCFCQLLIDQKYKHYSGRTSIDARPRTSSKSFNRWFLAVMLIRNPSLVRYRRQQPMDVRLLRSDYLPTYKPSNVVEETSLPIEHFKSVNVY